MVAEAPQLLAGRGVSGERSNGLRPQGSEDAPLAARRRPVVHESQTVPYEVGEERGQGLATVHGVDHQRRADGAEIRRPVDTVRRGPTTSLRTPDPASRFCHERAVAATGSAAPSRPDDLDHGRRRCHRVASTA